MTGRNRISIDVISARILPLEKSQGRRRIYSKEVEAHDCITKSEDTANLGEQPTCISEIHPDFHLYYVDEVYHDVMCGSIGGTGGVSKL